MQRGPEAYLAAVPSILLSGCERYPLECPGGKLPPANGRLPPPLAAILPAPGPSDHIRLPVAEVMGRAYLLDKKELSPGTRAWSTALQAPEALRRSLYNPVLFSPVTIGGGQVLEGNPGAAALGRMSSRSWSSRKKVPP